MSYDSLIMMSFLKQYMSQMGGTAQQNSEWNGKTIETAEQYLNIFEAGNRNEIYESNVKYMDENPDGTLNLQSGLNFFDQTLQLDDQNGDGKITVEDRGAQFMEDFDLDKDGEITAEEYLAGTMTLDTNKDGIISFEERQKYDCNKGFSDQASSLSLMENFNKLAESIDMDLRESQRKAQAEEKLNNIIQKLYELVFSGDTNNQTYAGITEDDIPEIAESIIANGGGVEQVETELSCRNLSNISIFNI